MTNAPASSRPGTVSKGEKAASPFSGGLRAVQFIESLGPMLRRRLAQCARMELAREDAIFDQPNPSGHGAEPKQTRRRPQIHANFSQGAPIADLSNPRRLAVGRLTSARQFAPHCFCPRQLAGRNRVLNNRIHWFDWQEDVIFSEWRARGRRTNLKANRFRSRRRRVSSQSSLRRPRRLSARS